MSPSSTRRLEQEQMRRATMKTRLMQAQVRKEVMDVCPSRGMRALLDDVLGVRWPLPGAAATSGSDDSKMH
jgi:hypothetical protein